MRVVAAAIVGVVHISVGCVTETCTCNEERSGFSCNRSDGVRRDVSCDEVEACEVTEDFFGTHGECAPASSDACCVRCSVGKPCGDSCIDVDDNCSLVGGCACFE